MDGEKITIEPDGSLAVPLHPIIAFIEGDTLGAAVWETAREVLDAAVAIVYGGQRQIEWLEVLAGRKAHHLTGEWLPRQTIELIREHVVAIKGVLTTPVLADMRSLNVSLRQALDLYTCVRPVRYYRGLAAPVQEPDKVDMVVFRENTEDVYVGLEWSAGSDEAKRLIEFLRSELGADTRDNSGIGIKPVSEFGSKRLIRKAIRYALDSGRQSVTLVHKGNIMRHTEGAFRNWGYELAAEEFAEQTITEQQLWELHGGRVPPSKVLIQDRLVDAMLQQVLLCPGDYSVLAMPNLNGDYVSAALAAQVGGTNIAPGANIGDGIALFEATHGSAPPHAGAGDVHPGAILLSGVMMLEYIGWQDAADRIHRAFESTLANRTVPRDLVHQLDGATELSAAAFGEAIIDNL